MSKTVAYNFLQTLASLGGGAVVERLNDKMKNLVKLCERTHQSGEMILKIKFKPSKNGNVMSIVSNVQVKEPTGEPIEGFLFADIDGNLSKDDPADLFRNGEEKQGNVQRIGMAAGQATRVDTSTEVKD